VNNGSLSYNHDRDGIDMSIGGCESPFRGRATDTLIAVRYQNNRLTVSTDIEGTNTWTECFSIDDIQLPTEYYFGFTAATGQLSDNHDIVAVRTFQLDSSEQRQAENRKNIFPSAPLAKLGEVDKDASSSSSWSALRIFFLVVLAIVICLGAVGAFYYIKRYRHQVVRFY
jgi:mannose-binding lectin 2